MTQIERIVAEIQRLKKEGAWDGYTAMGALDYIESYVNLVAREPSLPSNLDEAAKQFQRRWDNDQSPEASFIAGAQWRDAQIPKLQDSIDEAAEEYGRKEYSHAIHFWDEGLSKNRPEVMKEDFVNAFKAGAEWQKAKMLGKAVETVVENGIFLSGMDCATLGYKFGDKVKVIIVKEG